MVLAKLVFFLKCLLKSGSAQFQQQEFNIERVGYKDYNFNVWDIGGSEKMIPMWRHFISDTNCMLYVINGSRADRRQHYIEGFVKLVEYYRKSEEPDKEDNKILVLSNIFDMNQIQIDVEEFVDEIKTMTKYRGKIGIVQCSVQKEEQEKIKSLIFDFYLN